MDSKVGGIVGKVPWGMVKTEAGKTVIGMATGYAIKRGIAAGPLVAKHASTEWKELIEDGKELFKDVKELISPRTPCAKNARARTIKDSEDRWQSDQQRKSVPSRFREYVRRPSYPPPRKTPPPPRPGATDSPLQAKDRARRPPHRPDLLFPPLRRRQTLAGVPPSYPRRDRDLQRAPRPDLRHRSSDKYDSQRLRRRPTPSPRHWDAVGDSNVLPVSAIYASLDIDPAILDCHVRAADTAKTLYANEHNYLRVYFLSRLAKLDKWMTSNESRILIINGNDATYQSDQPFSIFSWYINALEQWIFDTTGARPLRCFAGAHNDFHHTINNAHTLMRSLSWQMIDQYHIESIRLNPRAGKPFDTIAQLNNSELCWLFEELYYQFTFLDAKASDNGQLIILVDGGNVLEEGSSGVAFEAFLKLLQRIVMRGSGGRRTRVFKVLILFPGKPSELCKELRGLVDVLRLPDKMPKSFGLGK